MYQYMSSVSSTKIILVGKTIQSGSPFLFASVDDNEKGHPFEFPVEEFAPTKVKGLFKVKYSQINYFDFYCIVM